MSNSKSNNIDEPKTCAYCGGTRYHAPGTPRPENYCRCNYRYMRMGESGYQTSNTSRTTTMAQMRKNIEEYLANTEQEGMVAFMFSVTRLDKNKIAKADAKRAAKK